MSPRKKINVTGNKTTELQNASLPDILSHLSFGQYEFSYRIAEYLEIKEYLGSLVHASLGPALKLACNSTLFNRVKGQAGGRNVFESLYNPSISEGHPLQNRFKEGIHLPYVVSLPKFTRQFYAPGDEICITLTLVGHALSSLPLFINAFEIMGQNAFGLGKGMAFLHKVDETICWFPGMERGLPLLSENISMHFISPLSLSGMDGELPAFQKIYSNLFERCYFLSHFHCGQQEYKSPVLPPATGTEIKLLSGSLSGFTYGRYHGSKAQKTSLSGWQGYLNYSGNFEAYSVLLHLGKYLHLGGKTSFGFGQYQLKPIVG